MQHLSDSVVIGYEMLHTYLGYPGYTGHHRIAPGEAHSIGLVLPALTT